MCRGCIHHDLSLELVFSHCTYNSLENIDDGSIEHQYWVGWAQQLIWNMVHSNINQDFSVNTKVVGSRVHHSEIDFLEEIFGVNTAACCENIEYSKLHLCEILFALTGYGQSWKCPKFSIYGNTLYHERSNSFLLWVIVMICYDRLIWWHYFVDNAFQCICFNSPSCLSDIFGTRRCIGINTSWVLIVVFPLSAKHLVGNSYLSWNHWMFGAVVRADEFVNSSIEFRLYSFDGLLYMVKFLWEFVRGSLHNIRDASHFYGSCDITITIWYCVSSFIYSILGVLLTSSCTFTWLQIRWNPFHSIALGLERSSFFFHSLVG